MVFEGSRLIFVLGVWGLFGMTVFRGCARHGGDSYPFRGSQDQARPIRIENSRRRKHETLENQQETLENP